MELNTFAHPELRFFFQCFLYLISDLWPGDSVDSSHEPIEVKAILGLFVVPWNPMVPLNPMIDQQELPQKTTATLRDLNWHPSFSDKLMTLSLKEGLCRTDVKALGQPYLEGGMSNEGEVSCSFIRC